VNEIAPAIRREGWESKQHVMQSRSIRRSGQPTSAIASSNARATIARDRPIILVELLSGSYEDPVADTAAICERFGYEAFIVQRGEKFAALPVIAALGKNTSWGTDIESRNVLFLPR
jgi:hypothetical protein